MVVTTVDNLPKDDPTYRRLEDNDYARCSIWIQRCKGRHQGCGIPPAVLEPPGPVSSNSVTYVIFYLIIQSTAARPCWQSKLKLINQNRGYTPTSSEQDDR